MKNLLLLFFAFSIFNCYSQNQYFADYFNNGNTYFDQQNYKQAIIEFTKCIEDNPNFEPAILNRGSAKIALGKYWPAIMDFNMAIKMNGRSYDAYFNRGIAKGKFGDHIGAVVDYCTAIHINSKYAPAYHQRGLEKIFLKQKEGGCSDLKKAKELGYQKADESIKEHCK